MMRAALIITTLLLYGPAKAQDFYAGKTISILVNYGAGGNADTDARLLAKHWARHIPGHPTIIIQNAPGAGGLRAINVLGKKAGVDTSGLNVGFFTVNPVSPLVEDPALQVSMTGDLIPIGGTSGWTIVYGRTDIQPGLKRPEDIVKAKKVFVGGYSKGSSHDARLKLALDVLGVEFSSVTGFPGQNDVLKAFLQNEVNLSASSLPAYLSLVVPNAITPGIGLSLWHYDLIGADGQIEGSAELSRNGIPRLSELYQRIYGAVPKGDTFEALLHLNNLGARLQRGVFLPRGAPREAVEALQSSYESVLRDPAFIADYEKVNNEKPESINARGVEQVLQAMQKVPQSVRAVLKHATAE